MSKKTKKVRTIFAGIRKGVSEKAKKVIRSTKARNSGLGAVVGGTAGLVTYGIIGGIGIATCGTGIGIGALGLAAIGLCGGALSGAALSSEKREDG